VKLISIKNIFFESIKNIKKFKKVKNEYFKYFSYDKKIKVINIHNNNTNLVFIKNKNLFRKFSVNYKSFSKIKSDYLGLKWFCKKKGFSSSTIIKKFSLEKNISFLDTKMIDGKKIKSWRSLKENYPYILIILNDYKKIFGMKKLNKAHCDLTFDNIIFLKKNYYIIDWEFFISKKKVKGYDAVYFLLSCVVLPYLVENKFTDKDKKIFLQLLTLIKKLNVDKNLIKNPFKYFRNSIIQDKHLYESYKLSKKKFFPFITPKPFEKKIVQLINHS